jgi:hypothetical protein
MSKVSKLKKALEAKFGKNNPAPASAPGIKNNPLQRPAKRTRKPKPEAGAGGFTSGDLSGRSLGPANPNAGISGHSTNSLGKSPNIAFGMSTTDRALVYKDASRIKRRSKKGVWADGKLVKTGAKAESLLDLIEEKSLIQFLGNPKVGDKIKIPPGNYEADIGGKEATVYSIDAKTDEVWVTSVTGLIDDALYVLTKEEVDMAEPEEFNP